MNMGNARRWAQVAAVVALATLGAACSDSGGAKTVTANDYRFDNLPGSVKPGTRLTFKNGSTKEIHEMVISRLPDTEQRSVEELLKLPESQLDALFTGPPAAVLITPPGGGDVIKAVGDGTLTEKGRYMVICTVPVGADPQAFLASAGPDGPPVAGGPPHFTKGMYGQVTVA